MTYTRQRPEKHLERQVLREIGRHPHVLVAVNAVGIGFRGSALYAVREALAPFGGAAVAAAVAALSHCRITYGLGVGSPDLVLSVQGRALGLELKSASGVVSPVQSNWHTAAARRGFPVSVVRSVAEAVEAVAEVTSRGDRQ